MSNARNRRGWNTLSSYYQARHRISLTDVHYGPYGPGEKALQLLGDVRGLDVLELGCGGGQNAVVLASWGAKSVTGVDQSKAQLRYARSLAKRQGVSVRFLLRNMEDLRDLEDDAFDLIVSSHAIGYVEKLDRVFEESARVLRRGGTCVYCLEHPIWLVVGQALENNDLSKVQDYFAAAPERWDWTDDSDRVIATFETTRWRLAQIVNGMISAGLRVTRIVEPQGYSLNRIRETGVENVPYADVTVEADAARRFIETNQKIPFSLIVCGVKDRGH